MILVTGGAGFIGSQLVQLLVEQGESVRVLERHEASAEHLPLKRIELVRADIRDRADVRRAVAGCRQVYHLAGNPNLWTRRRRDFDAVNRRGTVNVLEEALTAGADRVLHTSTESILAASRVSSSCIEEMDLRAEDMPGPYCLSKLRGEQAAWHLAKTGAPVVIVNPTLPIGAGDRGMSPPTRMSVAFCKGKLPAYLDCRLNFIDVRDVARGMVLAMQKARIGRRYLLGAHNVSLGQWLALLGNEVGRPAPSWRVPYPLALVAAYISEFVADHVTGAPPNATVTGVRLARRNMHFDSTASLAELGLQPRPLDGSIRAAVEWYRAMGWIPRPPASQINTARAA